MNTSNDGHVDSTKSATADSAFPTATTDGNSNETKAESGDNSSSTVLPKETVSVAEGDGVMDVSLDKESSIEKNETETVNDKKDKDIK